VFAVAALRNQVGHRAYGSLSRLNRG